MKIVYVIGNIHNSGGIERVLSGKANYLVNKGFEVSFVVIYKTDKSTFFSFDPKIKFHYLNFEFEKERGIKKKLNFGRNKRLFLAELSKLFIEIKPDIAISTFCKYSKYISEVNDGSKKIIERHFAKYKRAQYYSKLDKYSLGRFITYLYRISDYRVVKNFDKFIVLTHEDKEDWGNLFNMEVIENFLTFMPEKAAELDNKRVIALGRLNQQKQFDKLVRAWKQVSENHPDWKLCVFGDGEKRKSLDNLITELGLQEKIEINPAVKNVQKELLDSSIYAMTSKYEGFPLVLLETMSCGVPPVSFACKCGPREIINDGKDGFLVPFDEVDTFAQKITVLIEDEKLRKQMGRSAYHNIQRFSEDRIMKKWISLFKKMKN